MKCQEFEAVVVDLVRGEVTDPSLGTSCWAHAANCSQCAERLLEEEKLTAGLAALATQSDQMKAPDRIETVLRAAFRELRVEVRRIKPVPALNAPYGLGIAGGRMVWAMAAAAVLLVSVVLVRVLLWTPPTETSVVQMPTVRDAGGLGQPNGVQKSNQSSDSTPVKAYPGQSKPQTASRVKGSVASPKPASPGANSKTHRSQAVPSNVLDEMATNFIPLPYGSGLSLDEGWEMVHVSLPRSALGTLGAPWVSEQESTEMIQADVVLGQDGLARAIRFVQE